MEQDTGLNRQNTKDQFYTKEEVAKECVTCLLECLPEVRSWYWIEPSAGSGSFLKAVPEGAQCISFDIEPKHSSTIQANFLEKSITSNGKILVFGNPPFGSQSSLAKAFIKHSAKFADVIAFILPRSFQKPSMNRVFPPEFHCIHTKELAKKSFEVNGKDYGVPCIFQIWQKKQFPRAIDQQLDPIGFQFVKHTDNHDLVIRRVGANAGMTNNLGDNYNPETHYFIKIDEAVLLNQLDIIQHLNSIQWPSNTTGPRSLSKSEITKVLNALLEPVLNAME